MPMWVADMDFAAPKAITEALQARANHPVFGYSIAPESLYEALIDWLLAKHDWQVKREWIGGFKRDGGNVTTIDGLKELLGTHFKLMQAPVEIPFVIRETRHKFQHTLSEVTLWERIH